MKNAFAIMGVSRQLGKVCEQIESLASAIQEAEQGDTGVAEVYEGLLLDEMEHAQVLTLELTKLLSIGDEETNTDGEGSVFAAGDLTDEKAGEPAEDGAESGKGDE